MAVDVEALYRKYGPMVLRRCRFLLKNEEKALDIMQEVFVKVLQKKEQLNQDAPSSLLYTIATNLCINRLRQDSRRFTYSAGDDIESHQDSRNEEEQILDRLLLSDIFGAEKTSTKTMAVLHYVDGLTLEETAECMGMSVSGIRKRLRRLREKSMLVREGGTSHG